MHPIQRASLGLALAAALTGVALAQPAPPAVSSAPATPAVCPPMPAEPTLPDGSDPAVTRTQIEAGNAAYDAFALAAQAHLNCERAKLRDRQAALQARRDATQAEVEAFNAFATQWQTSSAAFLARQPAPRNNERGN